MSRKDQIIEHFKSQEEDQADIVIMYDGDVVIDIDKDNEYLITKQGIEYIGEYEFNEVNWDEVKVYAPVL